MLEQLWQWLLDPNNQKLLAGVLAALIIGVAIGRMGRSRREEKAKAHTREGDRAFFKGLQYIISNDHDQAIEEFTKSVQLNSDTVETYVALGNLYRTRGDIDRAIRIRQSIILRTNIDEGIRIRALFDLGLDYRKGGFLSRALDAFQKVLQKQPSSIRTLEEIEKIYEEMKDWENAFATRQKIAGYSKGDHQNILAHHQTELGKLNVEKGDFSKAKSCFKKALSIDERCVDANLHLGDLYLSRQDYKNAIATWKKIVKIAPKYTFLAYGRLEGAYARMKNLKPVEEFLKECAQLNSDAFTHLALARYLYNKNDHESALRELESALQLDPYFLEARRFLGEILLAQDMKDEALQSYKELLSYISVPYLKFQCAHCGFRPDELQWQCPKCRNWDTIDFMDSGYADADSPPRINESFPMLPQANPEESA